MSLAEGVFMVSWFLAFSFSLSRLLLKTWPSGGERDTLSARAT
jgi:hypothetical protein